MNKRTRQQINNKILFRLVELFLKLEKESKVTDELTNSIIQRKLQETKRIIGDDLSLYICNNIFILEDVRDRLFPHYCFNYNGIKFEFCLN